MYYNRNNVHHIGNILMRDTLFIAISVVLLFAPSFFVHAQGNLAQDAFSLSVSPAYPGTNQSITLSVRSFTSDLNAAFMRWYVDGALARQGTGTTALQTKTGAPGTRISVRVTAETTEGTVLEREATIRPADVDIYWEALTYTPSFYKGKALPSPESRVKVVALPEFFASKTNKINPADLSYTWEINHEIAGSLSGEGRQSAVVEGPRTGGETRVAVTVTANNEWGARREIVILSTEPRVVFYERRPTEGVRHERALQETVILREKEITVRAEPYFFSLEDIARKNLSFGWSMNNAPLQGKSSRQEVTFTDDGGSGTAELSLRIDNLGKLLQEASRTIFISFGENPIF